MVVKDVNQKAQRHGGWGDQRLRVSSFFTQTHVTVLLIDEDDDNDDGNEKDNYKNNKKKHNIVNVDDENDLKLLIILRDPRWSNHSALFQSFKYQ